MRETICQCDLMWIHIKGARLTAGMHNYTWAQSCVLSFAMVPHFLEECI
jgi:hypothetical protein